MENNLDDILVDPSSNEKKPKKKRKILIAVAFVLLMAVVILAALFVLGQQEPKEVTLDHAEFEKMLASREDQPTLKTDDLDRLIAEIKSKETPQVEPKQESSMQTHSQEVKDPQKSHKQDETMSQALANVGGKSEAKRMQQGTQEKQKKDNKPQQDDKSYQSSKSSQSKPSDEKLNQKRAESVKIAKESKNPKQSSMMKAFDSLQEKIPDGFYLQVGVFGGKPSANFMRKISAFEYHIEKINQNGKVVNRYLIGPFKSREKAQAKFTEVENKVTKPLIITIKK